MSQIKINTHGLETDMNFIETTYYPRGALAPCRADGTRLYAFIVKADGQAFGIIKERQALDHDYVLDCNGCLTIHLHRHSYWTLHDLDHQRIGSLTETTRQAAAKALYCALA